jgi:hypothetical protein
LCGERFGVIWDGKMVEIGWLDLLDIEDKEGVSSKIDGELQDRDDGVVWDI